MNDRRRTLLEVLIVVGFCLFLFFYNLGSFGLVGADEPRYAQVAREMLDHNNWITPVLYGQPWLEKPILYYWRAMFFYRIFGVNDTAARLPSATMALFLVLAVYLWVRRFRPGAQLDTALIVAGSVLVIGFGRAASTDMSLAAPFCVGMLCWWGWNRTDRRWWLVLFYAMIAVGTLAKGPVAPFLAAVIIVAYAWTLRDWRVVRGTLWIPGILVFLAIALPWYAAVQLQTPQFFRVFFLQHNLERFSTNLFRHKQPFWYYIPVFLVATLPWTTYAIAGLVETVREWRFRREHVQPPDGLRVFLLLWSVLPILFFSISQSKLPGYILPSIPPALILASDYLHAKFEEGASPNYVLAAVHAVLASVLIALAVIAPAQLLKAPPTIQGLLVASVLGIMVFFAVLLAVFASGYRYLRFVTLIPVILSVGFILRTVAPVVDSTQSERPVARQLAAAGVPPGTSIATFKARREVEYGLAWYRNQPIRVYERLEIPREQHIVVTRIGSEPELREILPGRELKLIGDYPPQGLAFYSVTAAP